MKLSLAVLFCACAFPLHARILEFSKADASGPANIPIELPLIETPYNLSTPYWPSMSQSRAITKDLYYFGHAGIKRTFGQEGLGWREVGVRGFSLMFDVAAMSLPGFESWLHEEYHRAVMGRWDIDSYNGVYDLNLGADTIPVRKVKDEDLISLKRNHPRDSVRLPAAGIEGSLELVTAMEKDSFFDQTNLHMSYFYFLSYVGVISYVDSGASGDVDDLHEENNKDEIDMAERDFVGHDFNSWVYDLFRPLEPYEDRGDHPYGDGIRRYRDTSDLTDAEKKYLNRQGALSYLNLLDPHLFGVRAFRWGEELRFNTSTRHLLTSFGYVIDQNIFLQSGGYHVFVRLHNYFNRSYYFPGFSLEVLDLDIGSLKLSPRLDAWLQPKRLAFETASGIPGGLAALKLSWKSAFIEFTGKTQGWVASIPYQERTFLTSAGISTKIN